MNETTSATDVAEIIPLTRSEATDLGREAYVRLVDALGVLAADDWDRPTDCDAWTVRDLAGHVAGMMWSTSKLPRFAAEQMRSARRAKADGGDPVDAMTAIQVERYAGRSTTDLVNSMREHVDEAIAGRRRMPEALARRITFPVEADGVTEKWSLSYLFGTIITRDSWLHRVSDLARAVETEPRLDADHDGRIVADVVAEWSRRHGEPFELHLQGPAGGRFRSGDAGAVIDLDALDFCRMLSGRSEPSHPLIETQVPF